MKTLIIILFFNILFWVFFVIAWFGLSKIEREKIKKETRNQIGRQQQSIVRKPHYSCWPLSQWN
jgi:hypothetical protein